VIVVDANVLLFSQNRSAQQHDACREWLERTLSGVETVGLPWIVVLAFLRLSTSLKIYPEPLPMSVANSIVSGWLDRRSVALIQPTEDHWGLLSSLLSETRISGSDVTDAHLAALTMEHEATLCTIDRGFARFRGLKTIDPLDEGTYSPR
jgi:toxin-antitoxin system PIN domain toxin